MKLTGPQQDRAAGLLVGMAVGDSFAASGVDNFRSAGSWSVPTSVVVSFSDLLEHLDCEAIFESPLIHPVIQKTWSDHAGKHSPGNKGFPQIATFGLAHVVALATLDRPSEKTFQIARNLTAMSGKKMLATACGLWSAMLADAVRTGVADFHVQLPLVHDSKHQFLWRDALHAAEAMSPHELGEADSPLSLVMQAWAFMKGTMNTDGPQRFVRHLSPENLATLPTRNLGPLVGAALGALHGLSGIPFAWRRDLTGPNGGDADQLMRRAISIGLGKDREPNKWPNATTMNYTSSAGKEVMGTHPSDTATMIGGIGNLNNTSAEAVVSLCRIGTGQHPTSVEKRDHATFWLTDSPNRHENPNLTFVLDDAARTVKMFRDEGKRVLIHCVGATSRTPTVSAIYGRLITGNSAWEEFGKIMKVLPAVTVNPAFTAEMLARPAIDRTPAWHEKYRHPDRRIIELITWSAAAELLRLYPDAWLDGPTGDSGAQAQEFVVMFDLQRYVGFRRNGGGIATNRGFLASWPQAVGWGGTQRIVTDLEERLELRRSPAQPWLSVGARLAGFAAAVLRMTYGMPGILPPQPHTRWTHAYAPGRQPSEQILRLDIQNHCVEVDQDSSIRVDGTAAFRLPYKIEEIDAVAFGMLSSLDLARGR